MSKIIKNNTASPVPIADAGVTIAASGQYTIPAQDYLLWAASNNIITKISDLAVNPTTSTLKVNDGSVDLSISDGTDLIKGIFPKRMGVLSGDDLTQIGHVGDRLKVDALAQVTVVPTAGVSGFAHGKVTASVVTVVRNTAYLEQTSNAQRSVVSSSASDSSAGTGARTIKITYLDASSNGFFTETLTLNGTTAVNTVNTNICYIEKIEVLSYGSFRANIGTISLKTTTGGGGSTIFSIAVGDNTTFQAHHYVPAGKTGYIMSITVSSSSGDSALFHTIYSNHTTDFDTARIDEFQCPISGSFTREYRVPIQIPSGFHVTLVVNPDSQGIFYGTIEYYDL